MRFKNYLKGLVLATALYGANLMGAQTDAPALKPEIRSSETPIVQVERSAGQRLQQEVERDGGTVEGQEVTAGEKANAAVQDFANDVYGAGDKVEDFLRENIGNAGGTIFGAPVKVVTGLTGGLTQGAGYVAQGATDGANWVYDNALAPTGEFFADGWNKFTGLFSSEEKAPEAPATPAPAETKVEGQTAPAPAAPQVETQTEDNRNIFERGWDGLTGAVEDAHNFMNENVYQPTGEMVQDAHNFMNENVYQPTGNVVSDIHKTMDKNVYTPVGDAVKGMFSSEEKAPETPATPAPEAQAEDAPAPAAPQAETQTEDNRNIFERGWDGLTGAVEDAHNFMNENVYQPTGKMVQDAHNFMNENVYTPVGDAVKGMFSSEEKAPEAKEPVVTMPSPAGTKEQAKADDKVQEEKGWFRQRVDEIGQFASNAWDKTVETVGDIHKKADEVIYTPVGNAVKDLVTPDRTEEMNKLSEFLKSKGLSDADIKQAVSIALGKQAESSVKEVKGTEIPAKETPSPAVEEVKTQSTVVPEQSVPTEQSENNAVANLAPSSLKDTLRLISDERAVGDYVLTGKNTDATITVTNPNYFNTGRA